MHLKLPVYVIIVISFIISKKEKTKTKHNITKTKTKTSKSHILRIFAKIWKSAYFQRKSVISDFWDSEVIETSSWRQIKGYWYFIYLFIYNIRRIARLFPTVHYALNLRYAARNEFERNMERRYDFRCRRKPKCSGKTCAGKYGSRTKFTYDSDWESNPGHIGERHGNNRCANPPALFWYYFGINRKRRPIHTYPLVPKS